AQSLRFPLQAQRFGDCPGWSNSRIDDLVVLTIMFKNVCRPWWGGSAMEQRLDRTGGDLPFVQARCLVAPSIAA
ncbi:hypothetical protein, partial [Acinetobacter baumannii]|uniref:hypothetical protein n=1 Tax=Acinetobacter baumannii TaxID=470 RepID=UPI001BB467EB